MHVSLAVLLEGQTFGLAWASVHPSVRQLCPTALREGWPPWAAAPQRHPHSRGQACPEALTNEGLHFCRSF